MRLGGFPDRAAQVLSLLLYSPAQDGKHIKCFPLRAELATNLIAPPGGRAQGYDICPTIRVKHNEKPFDMS